MVEEEFDLSDILGEEVEGEAAMSKEQLAAKIERELEEEAAAAAAKAAEEEAAKAADTPKKKKKKKRRERRPRSPNCERGEGSSARRRRSSRRPPGGFARRLDVATALARARDGVTSTHVDVHANRRVSLSTRPASLLRPHAPSRRPFNASRASLWRAPPPTFRFLASPSPTTARAPRTPPSWPPTPPPCAPWTWPQIYDSRSRVSTP